MCPWSPGPNKEWSYRMIQIKDSRSYQWAKFGFLDFLGVEVREEWGKSGQQRSGSERSHWAVHWVCLPELLGFNTKNHWCDGRGAIKGNGGGCMDLDHDQSSYLYSVKNKFLTSNPWLLDGVRFRVSWLVCRKRARQFRNQIGQKVIWELDNTV